MHSIDLCGVHEPIETVMYKTCRPAFVPRMAEVCKECGCNCNSCFNNNSLDLHREIEELKSKLQLSNQKMVQTERDFEHSQAYSEQEVIRLQDELAKLRDRYDRLFESHRKLQKLNHNLEDKLLLMVSKFNTESTALQKEIDSMKVAVVDAKVTICNLEEECEKYRNDCNTAVQLLQCKPSTFIAHKLNTLPLDLQERVKSQMSHEQVIIMEDAAAVTDEAKTIRVPMPTFPPTAMLYSVPRPPETAPAPRVADTVPTSLIARVLTQPASTHSPRRIRICSRCASDVMMADRNTQTDGWTNAPAAHRQNSTETQI